MLKNRCPGSEERKRSVQLESQFVDLRSQDLEVDLIGGGPAAPAADLAVDRIKARTSGQSYGVVGQYDMVVT